MSLECYIDGGCFPNPSGICSYGVLVHRLSPPDTWIWEDYGIVGKGNGMSNNTGEYFSLIKFLEWFDDQPIEDVIIKSDSKMLVNQMQGNWRVRKDMLYYPFFQRALTIMLHNAEAWKDKIRFVHIPRAENLLADELATRAREEYLATHGCI